MNKKLMKVITLILTCLLLVGAAVGITVAAEDAEAATPSVEIAKKNVSYDSKAQILYAVNAENVPEGATVQMLFGTAAQTAAVGEVAVGAKNANGTYNGMPVFFSAGIAAKDYRMDLYAAPVIVDADGKIIAKGEAVNFTPYDYAMARFDGNYSTEQLNLYKAFLEYGAAVQAALGYTEANIANLGGWIDAYYNVTINGETVATRPSEIEAEDMVLVADRLNKNFIGFFDGDTQVYEFGKDNTSATWYQYTVRPGNHNYTIKYADGENAYDKMDGLTTLPAGMGDANFSAEVAEGDTRYSTIKTEDGNTYLFLEQNGATGGTHHVTIGDTTGINYANYVAYEFDMRFDNVAKLRSDNIFMYIKAYGLMANGSIDYNTHAYTVKYLREAPNMNTSATFAMDEWFNFRIEFVKRADAFGYDMIGYVNGQRMYGWNPETQSFSDGSIVVDYYALPYLLFESRYSNETQTSDVAYSIDNLRIEVGKACEEHTYADIPGGRYLVSKATCNTGSVYYKSCSACGYMGEETFVADDKANEHVYADATCVAKPTCTLCGVVDEEADFGGHAYSDATCAVYPTCGLCGDVNEDAELLPHEYAALPVMSALAADATDSVPALYYESCVACSALNTDATFYYGSLDVLETGVMYPNTTSGGTTTPVAPGTNGIYNFIASESLANGETNYYWHLEKTNDTNTHNATISGVGASDAASYFIEFDMRWLYATNMRTDNVPVLFAIYLGSTRVYYANQRADTDGKAIDLYGAYLQTEDGWNRLSFQFTVEYAEDGTATGTRVDYYVNGVLKNTQTYPNTGVPKVMFETRYGGTSHANDTALGTKENGKSNGFSDLAIDFDNIYTGCAHTCDEAAEKTTANYLKSLGDCDNKSVYYKSCSICGKAGTTTFQTDYVHGDAVEVVEDKYVAVAADCTNAAVYYKSCKDCGAALADTFTAGETADHVYIHKVSDATLKAAATTTTPAVYYVVCRGCGQANGETFTADDVLYDMENGKPSYVTAHTSATLVDAPASGMYYGVFGEAGEKYLEIGKIESTSTGQVNFKLNTNSNITKQVLTYDFLNVGGGVNTNGSHPGWVKFYDTNGAQAHAYEHGFTADSISALGQKITNDTWVSVRIELDYTAIAGRTVANVYYTIDGSVIHSVKDLSISGRVAIVTYELRWNWSTIKHRIDNVYVTNEHVCENSGAEIANMSALKADATATTAAVYYKTCGVCGALTSETFSYGNVSANTVGAAPTVENVTFTNGLAAAPTTDANDNGIGDGVYFIVKNEEATNAKGEKVDNTYISFVDDNDNGQKKLTLNAKAEEGKTEYVISFDFRFNYADNFRHNRTTTDSNPNATDVDRGIFYNNTIGGKDGGIYNSSSDGTYVTVHGKSLTASIWFKFEYVFTYNADENNYDVAFKIDGTTVKTINDVTDLSVVIANRWGGVSANLDQSIYGNGKVDMSYDIDNIYIYAN